VSDCRASLQARVPRLYYSCHPERSRGAAELEKKVQTKDEVLAKLMAEHIALKKHLGKSNRQLGAA